MKLGLSTIPVRLAGEAVARGLHPDPEVFGELRAADWIAARRSKPAPRQRTVVPPTVRTRGTSTSRA